LLNLATNNIHNAAMEEEAASVAIILSQADGSIPLNFLPIFKVSILSPYGRYSYAVVDDHGTQGAMQSGLVWSQASIGQRAI
jgi:hypothetical protein